jgi:hypothetical protein
MTTTTKGGMDHIVLDGNSKRRSEINLCQCWIPADDQSSTDVWKYTACKEVCNNVFKQGHDAKMKGQIIRAFRANVSLSLKGERSTAKALAKKFGWEHYLTPGAVRKPRTQQSIKASKPAKSSKPASAGKPVTGETVSFKYRNSPLTGRVTSVTKEGVEVVFQTKAGGTVTKVFKPSEVKLVA